MRRNLEDLAIKGVALALVLALLVVGIGIQVVRFTVPLMPAVHAQAQVRGEAWTCSLDGIGATLTQCRANGDPAMKLYITDITATSTTGTAGQFILRYGTGTNCATGTASVYPSAASAVRFPYPGNTALPFTRSFMTPLEVPAGKDLCALGIATQLLVIQIQGFSAP